MVYFASGSFWQTFGQISSNLLALILVIVFANFLPKETYGTYRYLISLAGILNVFTLTGMSQAVTQAVSLGREEVLRRSVRYQLKWNLILMLASWSLGAYYFFHANFAYAGALLVLSLATPLTAALNTYGPYLAGKREFRLNNIFSLFSTLIYVLGMLGAIFWSGEVIWLIVAYAATTTLANLIFYFLTLWMFRPPLGSAESSRDVLKYGRHLTYINLMTPVVGQLDSVILNHFWGAVPLAVYSIATAIPNRAVPFVKSWVDVGFPKIANKSGEEIDATLYRRIGQGFLFGAVCAVGYIVVAPFAFALLLPQYDDAVIYTQLLSIMFLFSTSNRYLGNLLTAHKMSREILVVSVVQNVLRLIYFIVLGIWGGIMGLVIAQVAGAATNFLVVFAAWRFRKKNGAHMIK
jgi:O-antigen/teichoic acid export membrane protein